MEKKPRYTLSAGRTISLNGMPILHIARNGNDSEGYNLSPCDADTMAHVIVNLLNAAKVAGTWKAYNKERPSGPSDTNIARSRKYSVRFKD